MIVNTILVCYLIVSGAIFVVINASLFESAINAVLYYADRVKSSVQLEDIPVKPERKKRVRFRNKLTSHRIFIRSDPIQI